MTPGFLQKAAFVLGLCFIFFCWGVGAMGYKVFPYRQIIHVKMGIEAWRKMGDTALPPHAKGVASAEEVATPVETYTGGDANDLILMTGGFNERQDICPEFGCMAMIIDRSGKVLHSWEADPQKLFKAADFAGFTGQTSPDTLYVQGVDIDGEGNLVVTFQGQNIFPYQFGVAKFDWSGTPLWVRADKSHHWPTVGPDGRIYTPIARIVRDQAHVSRTDEALDCKGNAVFDEGVQILAPDGSELKRFWMADVIIESDMQGLVYSVRDDCDPHHVNGIALLTPAAAARLPGTNAGDLVVSLRSSSALIVMDPETGHIRRVVKGPMVAQHSPHVLPDGRFAVFDNLGGAETEKGSRILAIDPRNGAAATLFPRVRDAPGHDLFTEAQGAVAFSEDGRRMLVTSTLEGLVYEAEVLTGRPLWRYRALSDLGPFLKATGGFAEGERTIYRMQTQGARYIDQALAHRLLPGSSG